MIAVMKGLYASGISCFPQFMRQITHKRKRPAVVAA